MLNSNHIAYALISWNILKVWYTDFCLQMYFYYDRLRLSMSSSYLCAYSVLCLSSIETATIERGYINKVTTKWVQIKIDLMFFFTLYEMFRTVFCSFRFRLMCSYHAHTSPYCWMYFQVCLHFYRSFGSNKTWWKKHLWDVKIQLDIGMAKTRLS